MATSFRLRVVTPERQLVDEDVEEVTAPGAAGEFGVLPDHIAFLTVLAPGRLIYKSSGKRTVLAIFGGYAEVVDNVMTVLADGAEPVAEIDATLAQATLKDAEAQLASLDPSSPEALVAKRAADESSARLAATAERV
jgi:F-type H+-transporting ATPase subunit epsilon